MNATVEYIRCPHCHAPNDREVDGRLGVCWNCRGQLPGDGIPTKRETLDQDERLRRIEERLERIEEKLQRLLDSPAISGIEVTETVKRPPRPRPAGVSPPE